MWNHNERPMPIPSELTSITYRLLEALDGLTHGVFTRHGGVSLPPYATLNTAWTNGDRPEHVNENLLRIKRFLGFDHLVSSPQVHGTEIQVVDESLLETRDPGRPFVPAPPGDALVTRLPGVGLMIKIADCQAVFLVDPDKRVVANVHCGWRGSVKKILPKTVRFLKERFGCDPRRLIAAVSPSLGPCCAEFVNHRRELPPSFLPFRTAPNFFDFWAISRRQLMDAGLLPQRIEIAGRCTVCEAQDFFSYRRERITGRMAAVVGRRRET